MKSELYNKLIEYSKSNYYGFHMPGHKRNGILAKMDNPYIFDITEIDGFDNLHSPQGIILDEMEKARKFYHSKKTYFLVNGSSSGNLVAISAVAKSGDKIIIARNSHKSIYNAVELLQLNVEYVYPDMIDGEDIFGSYNVEDIKKIISTNQDAKAIVITTPTYEGVVSDVKAIAKEAHKYGMPLIVDAAHGAHFILSNDFPNTAVSCGADIVVESLHKTLPSLTQTAILHYNSEIIGKDRIEKFLGVYQTSSPSYVLMSSICNCLEFVRNEGREYGNNLCKRIEKFHNNMKKLKNLYLLTKDKSDKIFDFDCSKIVIIIKNNMITGMKLKEILNEEYHLEMEMASGNYVVAMTSVFDTEEGFLRLEKALLEIDNKITTMQNVINYGSEDIDDSSDDINDNSEDIEDNRENIDNSRDDIDGSRDDTGDGINNLINKELKYGMTEICSGIYSIRNEKICEIYEAESSNKFLNASKEYVYMYPPGIPIVVPGEAVSNEVLNLIEKYKRNRYEIISTGTSE